MTPRQGLQVVKRELARRGWLLEADPVLPSVVTVLAGGPVTGSWWGHERGSLIFNTCCLLEEEPDVLCVKLVRGKRTYLRREHWNLLWSLARRSGERARPGLPAGARALLARVERRGVLRLDEPAFAARGRGARQETVKWARALERALLCRSRSLHGEAGAHTTELASWEAVARERAFAPRAMGQAELARTLGRFQGEWAGAMRLAPLAGSGAPAPGLRAAGSRGRRPSPRNR